MKENEVIYFRKKESVSFSSCELSKEAIDFLEGKWILDGMDTYCNAIQFFNSNKKDERSALDYASCLRVIAYRSVLCVTDINQLLSLYTYERPFT